MRLLVIEDEKKAGEYLKKGLEESGFTVDVASNGIDGLHLALEDDYDLIARRERVDQSVRKCYPVQ